jgi:hypothetical protein
VAGQPTTHGPSRLSRRASAVERGKGAGRRGDPAAEIRRRDDEGVGPEMNGIAEASPEVWCEVALARER